MRTLLFINPCLAPNPQNTYHFKVERQTRLQVQMRIRPQFTLCMRFDAIPRHFIRHPTNALILASTTEQGDT